MLKARLDTERQLLAARAALTFGLAPSPGLEVDPEVAAANADFSGYQPAVSAAEPLMKSLVQRSLRPTPAQIETGTFLADVGDLNAVYESCYRRVRGASA